MTHHRYASHVRRPFRCVFFVTALTLLVCIPAGKGTRVAGSRKWIRWLPYSEHIVAERSQAAKPTAVFFTARWTVAADPSGGFLTPLVAESLAKSSFLCMAADMSTATPDALRRLELQELPALVLFHAPKTKPLVFHVESAEPQIISAIRHLSKLKTASELKPEQGSRHSLCAHCIRSR
ncbi:MAG: hypothetical protein AAF989_15370 [Planctomycetota bacterium]